MFDFGFWELIIIALVALLVVGPERLPKLAREIGRWVGKIKRFVSSVRSDIEQELRTDELKAMLQDQEKEINRLKTMMEDTEQDLRREVDKTQHKVKSMEEEIKEDGSGDFPKPADQIKARAEGNASRNGNDPDKPAKSQDESKV
ncbi:twin-arginine translocation proteinsubunit TatB [Ectothiorhodospira haloalkaliphila]|uniref:Sec-independent protein translocase protein TatB n=1 Tax=Ectothiorhodospira haloalkaliphila TaxID=421628 RepID=W8KM43_9GAMM|nr:Sec-independent protein translocase protein TatB [Ectothiorhodospira haloalkaliphila]AHK78052.1 twin-arginine translocation proteinsubunit TatB [Ectothiorhodospira haloalkaliphila]